MTEVPCVLRRWQDGPLGRALIAAEARLLATTFDDVFGQELLQLGTWGAGRELLAQRRMRQCGTLTAIWWPILRICPSVAVRSMPCCYRIRWSTRPIPMRFCARPI